MEQRYQLACRVLPVGLRTVAMGLGKQEQALAEEIRLRVGQPMTVLLPRAERELPVRITQEDLERLCNQATEFSRYGAVETLRQGYVCTEGGFRIGFCGSAVMKEGRIENLKAFSSAVIRIAREKIGVGETICPQLMDSGRMVSTLVIGAPGSGKTTCLRDMVRMMSQGGGGISPQRITLVDERGEVAATHCGVPQLQVGSHTDILDGCPKDVGMMMGLRTMNPQILAVDEITKESDLQAMVQASHCGVSLLATVHGATWADLQKKPLYREVMDAGIFQRAVVLSQKNGRRTYTVEVIGCKGV